MAVELAAAIVGWAEARLHLMESPLGSNDAEWMRRDLSCVGHKPGDAWCLQFAMAAWHWAASSDMRHVQFMDLTGNCDQFLRIHQKLGHVFDEVSTGAIVIYINSEGRGHHAGICLGIGSEPGTITAIEGNTNNNGSSEGIGVYIHERSLDIARLVCPKLAQGVKPRATLT